MAQTKIIDMCAVWPLTLRNNLGSRSWPALGSRTTIVLNIMDIKHDNSELLPGYLLWLCAVWPWSFVTIWLWRYITFITYSLVEEYWSWIFPLVVWNIIQIKLTRKKLQPGQVFQLYVHLDLRDVTFGIGYDKPLDGRNIIHICQLVIKL